MISRHFLSALALSAALPLAAFANTAPVLDAIANQTVPAGKSLVIPLTASDANGDPLSFTVASSNGSVIARVKTGLPTLQMNVSHTGDHTDADPDYSGTLDFLLFPDWTPTTAGIIGGLAQSGFYDGRLFFRIIQNFVIQGGSSTNDSSGMLGFTYPDEFRPQLIMAGDAQLCMANSGKDTNGSQIFITLGEQRDLDFNHTIFGQLARGFDLRNSMANTPVNGSKKPDENVTIDSATIVPRSSSNNSDAILLLTAPGGSAGASITVTVNDGNGGTSSKTFTATPATDDVNDPPLFTKPLPDKAAAKNTIISIPLRYTDLDWDPVNISAQWISSRPSKLQTLAKASAYLLLPPPSFSDALSLKIGCYEPATHYRGSTDDFSASIQLKQVAISDLDTVNISVGDGSFTSKSALGDGLRTEAGTAIDDNTLATITVNGASTNPDHYGATINWGDNTVSVGTIRKISATKLSVSGSHTYANTGTFPLRITIYDVFPKTGNSGVGQIVNSFAYIANNTTPITVSNLSLVPNKSAKRFRGVVTTFTDISSDAAAAGGYSALIDWGDGQLSSGTITGDATAGFQVSGDHTYTDVDAYSVAVRIVRTSDSKTAYGYSRMTLKGNAVTMPPFRNVDLQGKWLSLKTYNTIENSALQGHLIGQFEITNTGKVTSASTTVTVYYSTDAYFDDGTDVKTNYAEDTQIVQIASIPSLTPGKKTILRFVKNPTASQHAPIDLPDGVDMTNPSTTASTIITHLHADAPSGYAVKTDHFMVDTPDK